MTNSNTNNLYILITSKSFDISLYCQIISSVALQLSNFKAFKLQFKMSLEIQAIHEGNMLITACQCLIYHKTYTSIVN